jgi:hypothetical protein
LQDEYGIPVQIDKPALEEMGINANEPVHVDLRGISLRAALRLMLKPLQLTYIIEDEVLMITTPEEAESQLVICVYDVRDIVDRVDDQSVEQLRDTIASCIATDTWTENGGGEADIRRLKPALLVISTTRAVHDEVRGLLATIRAMRERPDTQAGAAKPVAAGPEADQVVTRAYLLEMGEAANPEAVRQQIRSLITSSLPDERWQGQLDDGQPVLLTILPDRVVLRHTPSVQKQVERLLADSGLASVSPKITGEMAGPGGYGGYGPGEYGGYGRGGYGGYGRAHGRGFEGGYGRGGYGAGRTNGSEEVPQPKPSENE